jgi:hypothetical protein
MGVSRTGRDFGCREGFAVEVISNTRPQNDRATLKTADRTSRCYISMLHLDAAVPWRAAFESIFPDDGPGIRGEIYSSFKRHTIKPESKIFWG